MPFSIFMIKLWQVSNIDLKNSHRRFSTKTAALKNLSILIEKYLCLSLFLITWQAYKPGTLLQRHSKTCFPVTVAMFLKTSILKDIYEHRFWTLLIQSGRNNTKNRDVSRDDNRRRIQNPVKHKRWSFLQK